jgi:hypothetical protein
MDDDQIREVLERLGEALSQADLKAVASCWEVPALVLSDQGTIAVAAMGEIERFFDEAVHAYQSQGIVSTSPVVERIEPLSEKLSAVDVRWPAVDSTGNERWTERSHYILQLGDDGRPHIRVAMTRTL